MCGKAYKWSGPIVSADMPTAHANGIDLFFDVHGEGPTVLLIAGLGAQYHFWEDDFIGAIDDEGFCVIRFDNRDVGESTHLDGVRSGLSEIVAAREAGTPIPDIAAYTLSDMAADTIGLLDVLGAGSAHVVGASLGGMIGQVMAIEHPERVATLTSIMSTTGDPEVGQASPEMQQWLFRPTPKNRDEAIAGDIAYARIAHAAYFDEERARRRTVRDIDRGTYPEGTGRQLAAAMAGPDRTAALTNLTVPTLVIHGVEDTLIDPSGGRATAAAVPGAHLVEFQGMGHDLPPALFDEVIGLLIGHFGP